MDGICKDSLNILTHLANNIVVDSQQFEFLPSNSATFPKQFPVGQNLLLQHLLLLHLKVLQFLLAVVELLGCRCRNCSRSAIVT